MPSTGPLLTGALINRIQVFKEYVLQQKHKCIQSLENTPVNDWYYKNNLTNLDVGSHKEC